VQAAVFNASEAYCKTQLLWSDPWGRKFCWHYFVHKMDVTPDGNPVIANSTINGVGMIEVK
jgi:hypothetical protein